jgi:hypothetical protein
MEAATTSPNRHHEVVRAPINAENLPTIVVLSSSALTDRIFAHTEFLNVLNSGACTRVWATSIRNPRFRELWKTRPGTIEEFPEIHPFKEFPYNYIRRLNEFVWDFRQRTPSRLSMWRHVRSKNSPSTIKTLTLPARLLALMKAERSLEDYLEKIMLNYPRSPEASNRLRASRPSVVVTTGPFQYEQPAVVAAAKSLGIPTMALIPSWDNVTTKNRMVFKYDGYLVWSEQTKQELHRLYPSTRNVPVYVVGAPQFDVFFQERFYQSREEYCAGQGLRPDRPVILYAIGSPNFIGGEHFGALQLAERVMKGDLGRAQMIVRPHPIHDNGQLNKLFGEFYPRVVVQKTAEAGTALNARSQDENQITEWVNTFRHADVVVNLFSTVTVDAAIFDRPVVGLDFDPEPGQPNQALIKDVNHLWDHFKPVAESGGAWLVKDLEEMVEAVRTYLAHPELHGEKRGWIAKYVCNFLDGRCGQRMAEAVLDFAQTHARRLNRI